MGDKKKKKDKDKNAGKKALLKKTLGIDVTDDDLKVSSYLMDKKTKKKQLDMALDY